MFKLGYVAGPSVYYERSGAVCVQIAIATDQVLFDLGPAIEPNAFIGSKIVYDN